MIQRSTLRNRILSRLPAGDFALIADKLELVMYQRAEVLAEADQPVGHVHFLEQGLVSVVARSPEGQSVEAGIIGREGFVHPALAFGSDRLPYALQMQLPDDAHRIARTDLMRTMEQGAALREALFKFITVYASQISFTVLSNSVHQLDERLARWLLMCHDRSDSDDLPLTHEFMGLMLAMRRPSVTTALHVLEGNGFIENTRGYVVIRNRAALEAFARDAYGRPEAEYRRLLGPI